MSQLLITAILLVGVIHLSEGVRCYTCTDVIDERLCSHNITECAERQSCFKSIKFINGESLISMGCLDNTKCSGKIDISTIIGRDINPRTQHHYDCMECCTSMMCNMQLCNHYQPSTCVDDFSVDCARMSSLFTICDDIHHAKHVCPYFCNLCDLVDGDWSTWTVWSSCSKSCGAGQMSRSRSCSNPQPSHGGLNCSGISMDVRSCTSALPCEVDGGWTEWGAWDSCSVSCGTGLRRRYRTCTNPAPTYLAGICQGPNVDDELCNTNICKDVIANSDCFDINVHTPNLQDGVYNVTSWDTSRTIQVYCDMTTDGGGWTVFQKRVDGSVDFYRNYSEYVHGFGDLHTEFWLGLDNIDELSSHGTNELRIDLVASNGTTAFEVLSHFYLTKPEYVLHVGNTTSSHNIDNQHAFGPYHNGHSFTTFDHDVDSYSGNCALSFHGAWWYNNCYYADLNGQYLPPGTTDDYTGMRYNSFIYHQSLKQSRMAFRRVN